MSDARLGEVGELTWTPPVILVRHSKNLSVQSRPVEAFHQGGIVAAHISTFSCDIAAQYRHDPALEARKSNDRPGNPPQPVRVG